LDITRFICEVCTYEWDAPSDDILCPFCNSADISPYHPPVKRRCGVCAFVWSEVKAASGCPVCGSPDIKDYIKPNKMKCSACSYNWTARELYPACPECGSHDACLDYDFDKTYELILEEPGEKKKQIIHTIADLCTVDIKKAAEMTEQCPVLIMENLNEMDAIQIKMLFDDMGARVTLKTI
jgi:Zn finger protein HypA/HybF involved in hydrogenase expression